MATRMNTTKNLTTPALHLPETTTPPTPTPTPTTPPRINAPFKHLENVLEDRNAVESTSKDGSNAMNTTTLHEVTTPPTIMLTTPPLPKLPLIAIPSTVTFESRISGPSINDAHMGAPEHLFPVVDNAPFGRTELNASSSISPFSSPAATIPPSVTNPRPGRTRNQLQAHVKLLDIIKAMIVSGIELLEPEIEEELGIVRRCRKTGLDVDGTPFNPGAQAALCQYGLQHHLRQHFLNEHRHKPLQWHSVGAQIFENGITKKALLLFSKHTAANKDDLDIATLRAIEKADDPDGLIKRYTGPIMAWYLAKSDAFYLSQDTSGWDDEDESNGEDEGQPDGDAIDSTPAVGSPTALNPQPMNPPAIASFSASDRRPAATPDSSTYKVQDHILDLSYAGPKFQTFTFPPRPSTIIPHPGNISIKEKESPGDPINESIQNAVIDDLRAGRFGRPYPPFHTTLADDSFVMWKGEVKKSAWAGDGSYSYIVAKATKKVLGDSFGFIDPGYYRRLIKNATTNLVLGTSYDAEGFFTQPVRVHASGTIPEAVVLLSVQTTTEVERQKWEEDFVIPIVKRCKAELDVLDPSPMENALKRQESAATKTKDASRKAVNRKRKGSEVHVPPSKRQCTSGVM